MLSSSQTMVKNIVNPATVYVVGEQVGPHIQPTSVTPYMCGIISKKPLLQGQGTLPRSTAGPVLDACSSPVRDLVMPANSEISLMFD